MAKTLAGIAAEMLLQAPVSSAARQLKVAGPQRTPPKQIQPLRERPSYGMTNQSIRARQFALFGK